MEFPIIIYYYTCGNKVCERKLAKNSLNQNIDRHNEKNLAK